MGRPSLQILFPVLALSALLLIHPLTVRAQQAEPAPTGVLAMLPGDAVTAHAAEGDIPAYTATAGTLTLRDQNGERLASIFYTAYVAKDGPPGRPVTFAFNGGPGASSAYLHLGLVGPRVAEFPTQADGAGARLRSNPDTWLRFTDLVLIDPVGTGWSRAAKAESAKDFWNVRTDAQVLAKTIALYVAKNQRGAAPKYLLGESYGGFRAAKVARTLQQEQGLVVSGIVMVSPFLDGALHSGTRFALGAALQLPALAAAELDRRSRFTPEALAEAERFAMTEYLITLAGPPPQGEKAETFYRRVAALTGIPVEVVARGRGFVRSNYVKHAQPSAVVSPYDASFAAPDPFPESSDADGGDPILDGFLQALGGLFVTYARDTLGYKTDITFELLNREVSGKWDWGGGRPQANATRDLRELLALNAGFRVLIAHGRSDVVTPYGISRYIIDHLPPIGTPDRVQLETYKGGHMFYLLPEARTAFTARAAAFYRGEP